MVTEIQGYRALSKHLREQIECGEFEVGSQLPTEHEMSQMYAMNRHTIRSALNLLEVDGYITRIRGKGTFVARRRIPYAISPTTSFSSTVDSLGITGNCTVLQSNVLAPSIDVKHHLELTKGEKVVALEILRCVDQVPMCITTSYLSHRRFPDLADICRDMSSLYALLRDHYGITGIRRAWSEIEAARPGSQEREYLQMPASMPVLITRSLVKDGSRHLLEYCVSRNRADSYTLRVNLENGGRSSL